MFNMTVFLENIHTECCGLNGQHTGWRIVGGGGGGVEDFLSHTKVSFVRPFIYDITSSLS